ncbi:MAG: 1,4-dihydroxy-2-naphthoate polyprenyltransferase [Bacteroidales bacterium]|nr:1,4-dihydroxy-2-naphthoate polyprenyltransferase [Bacteroidales bacterium]MCF8457259.1 1,4-dihydroxy-2-naphthoate polyprenyltransferase [Bacteroidales bacterium]
MTKTQAWIHAFRLRTLPLALSSIIMGAFLANFNGRFSWTVSLLAALTTLFLQILSNLANDYGDSKHGVDNLERQGPERAVQSGIISPKEMKRAVILFSMFAFASGVLLLIFGLGNALLSIKFFLFLIIGVAAILSAIKYTIGKKPYGYSGFGDLFVFLFFGLAGVLGTYFLNTSQLRWDILLPAVSLGLLSTGVLNLNNLRDVENDRKSGKHTLVVKMGSPKAKWYHAFLLIVAMLSALLFTLLNFSSAWQFVYILTFPFFIRNIQVIFRNKKPKELDPFLKQLALSTLLFAIAFGIGFLI